MHLAVSNEVYEKTKENGCSKIVVVEVALRFEVGTYILFARNFSCILPSYLSYVCIIQSKSA